MYAVLNSGTIRNWDRYTIEHEPVSSADLMERAASECTDWILEHFREYQSYIVFCGTGNNGGDGLVIARKLIQSGMKVCIVICGDPQNASPDFTINLNRLNQLSNFKIFEEKDKLPEIFPEYIVIDAIFGTGLNRIVTRFAQVCIEYINNSLSSVVSVDMPSGLFSDVFTPANHPVVRANYTLSFQVPKLAFFIPENNVFVGDFIILNIGLSPDFESVRSADCFFLQKEDIKGVFAKRSRHANKWQFGHSLLIAGSAEKMGAAVISSRSALRSGIGLLTVHTVFSAAVPLINAIPEAMLSLDPDPSFISVLPDTDKFSSIGIGPGIGMEHSTASVLEKLLRSYKKGLIIDADAINLIAKYELQDALPSACILTPHVKEFERLAGTCQNGFERIELQKTFSKRHGVYILLKGAYSSLSTPDGRLFFNSTGNPGMAKGGSGDCLTGIITALLAQGFAPEKAATVGMMVHGMAGDLARDIYGEIAMLASDIIEVLPNVYDSISE